MLLLCENLMNLAAVAAAGDILDEAILSCRSHARIQDRDLIGSFRLASWRVLLGKFSDLRASAATPRYAERIMVSSILNFVTAFTA
jgi:hypothetical protein